MKMNNVWYVTVVTAAARRDHLNAVIHKNNNRPLGGSFCDEKILMNRR